MAAIITVREGPLAVFGESDGKSYVMVGENTLEARRQALLAKEYADTAGSDASAGAEAAEAWATGTAPGGGDTKSAREWAIVSEAAASSTLQPADDANVAVVITDGSPDENILATFNKTNGAMTFTPDAGTQRALDWGSAGYVIANEAVQPSGRRASKMFRQKLVAGYTAVSSSTSDATLTTSYAYVATPALFGLYGGIPINISGRVYLQSISLPSGGNLGSGRQQIVGHMAVVTDGSAIEFAMGGSATRWQAFVDGQPINDPTPYAATTGICYQKVSLGPAYPPGRRVDIYWEQNVGFIDGSNVSFPTVKVSAGAMIAAPTTERLKIAAYTDSYGEAAGATSNLYGLLCEAAKALAGVDADIWMNSTGGSGYTVAGGGYVATNPTRLDWLIAADPDVVWVMLGINDAGQAGIQAAALATLQGIRSRCPNALIQVFGAWGGSTGPSANVIACENSIKAAVYQFADNACLFIPVSTDVIPWIHGTGRSGAKNGSGNSDVVIGGVTGADPTHPTDVGHRYLGAVKVAEAARPGLRFARKVH